MTEQELLGLLMIIGIMTMLYSIPYASDYIDDCVDSYKKYRKNKQTH
jgi:hypothetical protein